MDAEDIVEASAVTLVVISDEDRRLSVMAWAPHYLAIGRSIPPTIQEVFEMMHYLDHWLATGAIPQEKVKLTVVGGTDAKPIK